MTSRDLPPCNADTAPAATSFQQTQINVAGTGYTDLLPSLNPCPKCQREEFVRFERVIKGALSMRLYYCGSCDYEWRGGDAESNAVRPPIPKPRTRVLGRKHGNES